MLIWTGTAAVENGSTTVAVDTGAALTAEVVTHGAMVVLDGIVYFADSLTDTTTLELTRVYAGTTGTVDMEIWPVSQNTTSLVNLAQVVARTQAQINVLDKNSQGLFYSMLGVTGAADPGPGKIALDNATPGSITAIYIDNVDANGRTVDGLVDLWTSGTVILIRSLTSTAYVALRLPSGVTAQSGYRSAAVQYIDHDGVIADGEPVSIGWSRVGEGLEIDAVGNFADRATYNTADAGFVYLSTNGNGSSNLTPSLYRKNSATPGDWSAQVPFQGPEGDRGWSPVFAVVSDDARRVLRLVDYVGGEGAKPTDGVNQYVSTGGLTSTIGSATDIRGPTGLSAYAVAVSNGFSGTQSEWLESLVGASAYQVAVANGFSGDEDAWLTSLLGADGSDPGILLTWDDSTDDADAGAGKIWANSADLTTATQLFISKTNRAGSSIEAWLLTLASSSNTIKGDILITDPADEDQIAVQLTGVTNASGYVKLAITGNAGVSSFANGLNVSFQFSRAGAQGSSDLASVAGAVNGASEKTSPVADDYGLLTDSEDSNAGKKAKFGNLRPAIGTLAHGETVFTDSATITAAMVGRLLVANRATAISFNFEAAATLGAGWNAVVKNIGVGDLTLAPDGSEQIDGEDDLIIPQGQSALVTCDGVAFRTTFAGGGVTTGKAIAMAIVFGG